MRHTHRYPVRPHNLCRPPPGAQQRSQGQFVQLDLAPRSALGPGPNSWGLAPMLQPAQQHAVNQIVLPGKDRSADPATVEGAQILLNLCCGKTPAWPTNRRRNDSSSFHAPQFAHLEHAWLYGAYRPLTMFHRGSIQIPYKFHTNSIQFASFFPCSRRGVAATLPSRSCVSALYKRDLALRRPDESAPFGGGLFVATGRAAAGHVGADVRDA